MAYNDYPYYSYQSQTVFKTEENLNFGVNGVNIKRTLSNYYDPYSGIDLTSINTCDYVEIMTLSVGQQEIVDVCEDPFATNGPVEYGGNGQPGACYNGGTVNFRDVGGFGSVGGWHVGLYPWLQENAGNGIGATEPFEYTSGGRISNWPGDIYGLWTPNVWGFQYTDPVHGELPKNAAPQGTHQ